MDNQLIDPPVGPYSPPGEIMGWLEQLKAMPRSEDVALAIEQAERWLKRAEEENHANG